MLCPLPFTLLGSRAGQCCIILKAPHGFELNNCLEVDSLFPFAVETLSDGLAQTLGILERLAPGCCWQINVRWFAIPVDW